MEKALNEFGLSAKTVLYPLYSKFLPYPQSYEDLVRKAMKQNPLKAIRLTYRTGDEYKIKAVAALNNFKQVFEADPWESFNYARFMLNHDKSSRQQKIRAAQCLVDYTPSYEAYSKSESSRNRMIVLLKNPELVGSSVQTDAFKLWAERTPLPQMPEWVFKELLHLRDTYKTAAEKPEFYQNVEKLLHLGPATESVEAFADRIRYMADYDLREALDMPVPVDDLHRMKKEFAKEIVLSDRLPEIFDIDPKKSFGIAETVLSEMSDSPEDKKILAAKHLVDYTPAFEAHLITNKPYEKANNVLLSMFRMHRVLMQPLPEGSYRDAALELGYERWRIINKDNDRPAYAAHLRDMRNAFEKAAIKPRVYWQVVKDCAALEAPKAMQAVPFRERSKKTDSNASPPAPTP